MAHFDGSAEFASILLCILVLYLVLVGIFVLAGRLGRGPGRFASKGREPGRRQWRARP